MEVFVGRDSWIYIPIQDIKSLRHTKADSIADTPANFKVKQGFDDIDEKLESIAGVQADLLRFTTAEFEKQRDSEPRQKLTPNLRKPLSSKEIAILASSFFRKPVS